MNKYILSLLNVNVKIAAESSVYIRLTAQKADARHENK